MTQPQTPGAADDDLLESLLAETRTEVGYADHKASLVLASLGIGFSAFLGGLYASPWDPSDLPVGGAILWWVGAVVALGAVGCACLAVYPRTGDSSHDQHRRIYYWGQVATFDTKEEFVEALAMNPPDPRERTLDQSYVLSRLVAEKYRWVQRSLAAAGVAAGCMAAAGIVELVWG